jgi:hypothetical protein
MNARHFTVAAEWSAGNRLRRLEWYRGNWGKADGGRDEKTAENAQSGVLDQWNCACSYGKAHRRSTWRKDHVWMSIERSKIARLSLDEDGWLTQ